jgi:hypothetical protein
MRSGPQAYGSRPPPGYRGPGRRRLDHLQVGAQPGALRSLQRLATNELAATEPDQARKLRSQADAIYQELGLPRPPNPVTLEG